MKKRDLGWFLIGFGAAFILLNILVSFYTLRVIIPSQISAAAGCAETACYSAYCYDRLNITTSEYLEIQNSCRDKTQEALVMAVKSEGEMFMTLIFQNFNWILLLGIAFLVVGFVVFRKKKPVRSVYI